MFWRRWSLARRLFLGNLLFTIVLSAAFAAVLVSDAGTRTYEQTRERMLSVATAMADSPFVVSAAASANPSAVLQPYAAVVMGNAGVDFVTMMNPGGVRWTHPDPAQIGRRYSGSIAQARAGLPYVETTAGTLGPSVRAIVPIKDPSGAVVGMVATGVTVSNVEILVAARLPAVLALAAALLAAGSLASWLLGRYLKRVTLGWGPEELGQLFTYYESVLHSVREGLALVGPAGSLVLYNDHAALLLGIGTPPAGRPGAGAVSGGRSSTAGTRHGRARARSAAPASTSLDELALPESLLELLRSGRTATDEVHLAGDRLLVVSQRPARAQGGSTAAGTVVTLRDHTELTHLAGRLSSTQTLVEALRSQTHEHANRLHAIISLIELGKPGEALEFAAADHVGTVQLGAEHVGTLDEPYLAALLLGKQAQADERGVALEISGTGTLPPDTLDARELVTLLGNLVDNALDAAAGHTDSPTVWVDLLVADGALTVTVADNGPGLPTTDLDVLGRIGTTGKDSVAPGGRGYGIALIRRAAAALGGTITGENDGGAVMTAVVPLPHAPGEPDPPRQDDT